MCIATSASPADKNSSLLLSTFPIHSKFQTIGLCQGQCKKLYEQVKING